MSRPEHYHRDLARERNGTELGAFVIELDGKWKRSGTAAEYRWGTFDKAKVYSTRKHALNAAKTWQRAIVMEKLSNESLTLIKGLRDANMAAYEIPNNFKAVEYENLR